MDRTGVDFSGLRAISVDDERINLLLLEELAKGIGLSVESYDDPLEAARGLGSRPVDIAFVDYLMPGMDGIEFTRELKRVFPGSLSVIITSLSESRDVKIRALEAGASEFLLNPLDSAEFLARVGNLAALIRSRRALESRAIDLEREIGEATAVIQEREFETLVVLGRAAEYKDPETANHISRVAHSARLLAEKLGLPGRQSELVFRAAPLHDVGKMGIPDSLLLKPASLTPEEFAVVKNHTEIGFDILKGGESPALKAGAQIALTHHERFDGTGYPRGLRGSQISLFGRIVTVADCYDAMISRRPYKEPWPLEKVIGILMSERGRQFDPDVVDALVSLLPEMAALYERLKDW